MRQILRIPISDKLLAKRQKIFANVRIWKIFSVNHSLSFGIFHRKTTIFCYKSLTQSTFQIRNSLVHNHHHFLNMARLIISVFCLAFFLNLSLTECKFEILSSNIQIEDANDFDNGYVKTSDGFNLYHSLETTTTKSSALGLVTKEYKFGERVQSKSTFYLIFKRIQFSLSIHLWTLDDEHIAEGANSWEWPDETDVRLTLTFPGVDGYLLSHMMIAVNQVNWRKSIHVAVCTN